VVGRTTYAVNRNGYHLIIDDVPALICQQCNEVLFTEDAVRLVQQMIRSLDVQRQELHTLPVTA
jgi:YgiT-type zinc finger domain-containing protein